MTEAEWLACESAREMLLDLAKEEPARKFLGFIWTYFSRRTRIAQERWDRKLHLFACACFRRNWSRLTDERIRAAVEVVERFVDKKASREELLAAGAGLHAARDLAQDSGWYAAWYGCRPAGSFAVDTNTEWREQANLLRDILGNPFHPVSIGSSWLNWHSGLLVSMARAMYDGREFIDMPILADALEEAGCTNADILNHCRRPGEHVRGCWVIDLILSKE